MAFFNPQIRILTGAFCISFSAIFVRLVEVPASTSGFYRVFLGGIALCLYMLATGLRFNFSKRVWLILGATAVFFAADLWFWHRSIQYIGPGLSTLLASLQVFFVTIIGALFLGQKATPRQILAIPVALIGLSLIVGLDWSVLSPDYRLGVIFGIFTAISYSLYLLSLRRAQQETRSTIPVPEIAAMSLLTAVILAISVTVEGESLSIGSASDASWLLAYAILAHCVGWLLISSALAHVTPAVFGLSLLLQPTLSFIWDILLFDRGFTAIEASGALVTLVAIFIGSVRRRRRAAVDATIEASQRLS